MLPEVSDAIRIADEHLAGKSVEFRKALAIDIQQAIVRHAGRMAEDAIKKAFAANREKTGTVPERETAWLVERKCSPPQYAMSRSWAPELTQDPWRAQRFDTEREAYDCVLQLGSLRDECRAVEHVFINKR